MQRITLLLIAVLAAAAFVVSGLTPVQAASGYLPPQQYEYEATNDKPLMVIRFNQRKVYFEKPLFNTLAKAVQVKPDLLFDIVAVAPAYGDKRQQQALEQNAAQNAGQVVAALQEMGVPRSRMSLTHLTDASVDFAEVRLFVK